MKQIRVVICILTAISVFGFSAIGGELSADKAERVRTAMTICGAALGLAVGIPSVLDVIPAGTCLSKSLLVAIPAVAMTTTTGALAGYWIADTTLTLAPSLLMAPIVGAGLGMIGSAIAGGASFALTFAIAVPVVEVSVGDLNYAQSTGMGFLAGAVWGGIVGIPSGTNRNWTAQTANATLSTKTGQFHFREGKKNG